MKELYKRSISGLLFAAVLIGTIWYGPWSFALLFGLFSIFILKEFYQLSKAAGISPQKNIGILFGFSIFLLTFLYHVGILTIDPTGFCLSVLFVIPALELYRKKKNALENISVTLFGILYIILPFSLFNYFVFPAFPLDNNYDPILLISLFFLIWSFDSGAYLFGVAFGKHRLFERISPKKSWEGFFGGWFLCIIFGIALQRIFQKYDITFMILLATIVTISGTFGDLVESMIKRNLGIKDSGKFLPGHGGLLDRFDSILFASPFVYLLIRFFG
ncbi:MAG: phosphatidate cytidylyltransferase [Prolixibacteraceae bacterium]